MGIRHGQDDYVARQLKEENIVKDERILMVEA
jgi:hypothetical protein